MKLLIVLSALVACCVATDCDALARIKVKEQWNQAYGGTGSQQRIDFGAAIWRSFFVQAPESLPLFVRVNGADIHSGEFEAHSGRVLEGFGMTVSILNDVAVLESALKHLNKQHKDMGISPRYFDILKNSLLKVIPASIGKCFDAKAFSACYDVIADGITQV